VSGVRAFDDRDDQGQGGAGPQPAWWSAVGALQERGAGHRAVGRHRPSRNAVDTPHKSRIVDLRRVYRLPETLITML
jgi:hypothetical protein